MKLSRLYQPRNPLFWLMVTLQALSTVFMYMLRAYEAGGGVTLVLGVCVVLNAVLGIVIAVHLVRDTG